MKKIQSKYNEPDFNLLQAAKNGDHRAFAKLVHNYEELVFSFAFKVCRNKEKASETLQDTFINVYRKLDQFDNKSKFTTWLYSIVINNCLMKHRRTKLQESSISLNGIRFQYNNNGILDHHHRIIHEWKSTPLDIVMNKELQELLDLTIKKLPIQYRLVFTLRDIEGCSIEETAKILKLSVPAVKSRLRRARVFLREQLNDYMAA